MKASKKQYRIVFILLTIAMSLHIGVFIFKIIVNNFYEGSENISETHYYFIIINYYYIIIWYTSKIRCQRYRK